MKDEAPRIRLNPDEHALVLSYRKGELNSLSEEIRAESYREKWLAERAKGRTLRRMLTTLQGIEDDRKEVLEELQRRCHAVRISETKPGKGKDAGAFVAALSDAHVGERVDPATVQGVNTYNPEVAHDRLERYFNNVIKVYRKEAVEGIDLHTFVLALLGDFITGHLHEDQVLTNTLSPMEETIFAFEHLRDGIRLILSKLSMPNLVIPCCLGNHGRTTQKMLANGSDKTNFETIIYSLLINEFKSDPRVQMIFRPSYATVVDVLGMRLRFSHGEKVRGNGGVGGISIPLNKWIDKSNKEVSVRADYDVLGHHHTLLRGRNFMINGSVIGTTAYGAGLGYTNEPARQGAFVILEGCPFVICENTIFLGH